LYIHQKIEERPILFFSDACYYLSEVVATAPQAEAECGNLGGRLASFAISDELIPIRTAIPKTELWLGKNYYNTSFQ
jgi:hypothetical protein